MKKKLSICLFCIMVCCGLCAYAAEGDIFTLDGIEYQVRGGEAHVWSFVEGADIVVFRETANGYPVVYAPMLDWDHYVSSGQGHTLIIEEGVTTLQDGCFNGWENLETIVLPSTLRFIGEYTFAYNTELAEVTLPEGLETIGASAFNGNEKLKTIRLPSTLQTLGAPAFDYCEQLRSYDVAEGNQYFKAVDGVLYSKDGRTLVRYPAGREGAFEIPASVEKIDPSAFGYNVMMTSLTVPEGITVLPSGLLSGCYALKDVYIPSSVVEIEEGSLPWYGDLSRVHVAEGNPVYVDQRGVLFARAHPEQILLFPRMWGLSYDVPPEVTEIDMGTFAGNNMLTTLSIPRGITELPDGSFYGCTALERISLPITLKRIGMEAFGNCFMLTSITLPQGLEEIDMYAFMNCPGITEITLPDSVTTIGAHAFGEDVVIYASEESAGYWYAWEHGTLWAVPGGTPEKVSRATREHPTAVVNNSKADDTLNLREGPSEAYTVLGKYPNGTTMEVLGTEGEWSHVRLGDGAEGYMFSGYLSFMEGLQRQEITWARRKQYGHEDIVGQPVYVYSHPMEDAPRRLMEQDVSMRIEEAFGIWYKVAYENEPGYVLCQYFSVSNNKEPWHDEGASYAIVTNPSQHERLHLRREPSTKAESLGRYVNGTQVEIIEFLGGDWLRVRVDGKDGYMMEKFLTIIQQGEASLWGNG